MKLSNFLTRYLAVTLMAIAFLAAPSAGHSEEIITSIRVDGAQRIDTDTVLSYIELAKGDRFDAKALRTSVKTLYETGYFKDVSFSQEGGTLVVVVQENPMVNDVSFEGNKVIDDETLEKLVKLKPDTIFTQPQTQQDIAAIQQSYRVKGLFLAQIDVKFETVKNNKVDLIYIIEEGEKSKVREVRIIGNSDLSDKELLKSLMIKPTNWLSWYTEEDTYDKEKLQFDQSQLKNHYLDEGYVRVSVDSSIAELTPDRSAFIVTHTVREGERYRLGKVTLNGDFDELSNEELFKEITVSDGEWYSRKEVKQSISNLTDRIGDFGYAFLRINPNTVINDEERTIDLDFVVSKGRRVFVNRIEISGNTRTHDEVVRREVSMIEGDIFSASNLRKSKGRIQSLQYFKTVDISTPMSSSKADNIDVKIEVEEKPTGAFTIGAGYSSADAFVGTASVSQNNFLGRGQKLAFSFALSSSTQNYNISFTEPYFLGKNLSAGFDLFNKRTEPTSSSSYETNTIGAGLRLGIPISKNLMNTISYRLSKVEVTNNGDSYSTLTQAQADNSPYIQSMISNSLNWNNVDNAALPTTGRVHKLSTSLSGLGGDVKFFRAVTEHQLYRPITNDGYWVGHITGKVGYSQGIFSSELPIYERFQLGGSGSIRGFKRGGLGPRTTASESYGGTIYETLSGEVIFPIYGLTDKGVRGVAFIDSANLSDSSLPSDVTDDASIRVSSGVGINWNSPFGPLKVIFAHPLVKGEKDDVRVFDFSMGTAF
ncbi:MAG: outer membrane protein assembly factor BamA [Magnetococcales bacterium]|nr:outer membrane protein assembly factor BamA [Magnetococcales bacterium]